MSTPVVCPQCGKSHNIPESRNWQAVKCICGATMPIPSSEGHIQPSAIPILSHTHSVPHSHPASRSFYRSFPAPVVGGRLKVVRDFASDIFDARPLALSVMLLLIGGFCMFAVVNLAREIITLSGDGDEYSKGWIFLGICYQIIVTAVYTLPLIICYHLWNGRLWARFTMYIIMSMDISINLWIIIDKTGYQSVTISVIHILVAAIFIYFLSKRTTKEYCID